MIKNINVHYVGNIPVLGGVDFALTCRTLDGVKAYGLDCKKAFKYKNYLKNLGFKWDSSDRAWYTVNTDINNIVNLVIEITYFVGEDLTMGIEDGFLNQSKINAYLIASCSSNAVADTPAQLTGFGLVLVGDVQAAIAS